MDEALEDLELVDPFETCLLEGRRTNPNSSYISYVSREELEEEGMKRLKDGATDFVDDGNSEYELAAAE